MDREECRCHCTRRNFEWCPVLATGEVECVARNVNVEGYYREIEEMKSNKLDGGKEMSRIDDKKVEASIPVQSRVDIRVLAEMVSWWEEEEGRYVKSMSQLVSWTVELCSQVLKANGVMPRIVETIYEADEFLQKRGLYQPGMKKRGKQKLVRGRQLENLRLEGVDPSIGGVEGHNEYRRSHNSHSVVMPDQKVMSEMEADYRRREKEDMIKESEKSSKKARESIKWDENGVCILESNTRDQYTEEDRRKDEETRMDGVEGIDKVRELLGKIDKKSKNERDGIDEDEARPLDEEELEEKIKKREEKDKKDLEDIKNCNEGIVHKVIEI